MWLKSLLDDVNVDAMPNAESKAILLYSDSLPVIEMYSAPKENGRSKHVQVHWHWVREQVARGKIYITHVKGIENIGTGLIIRWTLQPLQPPGVLIVRRTF